jgi:hypothetical protein
MVQQRMAYDRICDKIWTLGEQAKLPDGVPTRAIFPRQRQREMTDLLIVGQSPNYNGVPYTKHTRQEAEEHAVRYEFVRKPGGPLNHRFNHEYYERLLNFVRRVDSSLGVWWEACDSQKKLVEFIDALPLATRPRSGDFEYMKEMSGIRATYVEVLKMELDYYRPRVVWAHSRFAEDLINEIYGDGNQFYEWRLICSRFFDGKWPSSEEAGLLVIMRQGGPSPK